MVEPKGGSVGAILFIVLLLGMIGGVVWFFFFRDKDEDTGSGDGSGSGSGTGTGTGSGAENGTGTGNNGGPAPTWDCGANNACTDPGTGSGLYSSLAGCQASCGSGVIDQQCTTDFDSDAVGNNDLMCPETAPACVDLVASGPEGQRGKCATEGLLEDRAQQRTDADWNDIIWPNRWKGHEGDLVYGEAAEFSWATDLNAATAADRAAYIQTIGSHENAYWDNPSVPGDKRHLTGDALKAKAEKLQRLEGCKDKDYYEYDAKYLTHDPDDCVRWTPRASMDGGIVGKDFEQGYCLNKEGKDQNDFLNNYFKTKDFDTEPECLEWCSMEKPWLGKPLLHYSYGNYRSDDEMVGRVANKRNLQRLDPELWRGPEQWPSAMVPGGSKFAAIGQNSSPMTGCEWKPDNKNVDTGKGECSIHTSPLGLSANGDDRHRCYIKKAPVDSSS